MTTPTEASVFGRPDGVTGSFDTSTASSQAKPQPTVAAPDPVLAEAFGRPAGAGESLQRDPDARYGIVDEAEHPADPWRDPQSAAALTAPALSPRTAAAPTTPGPKLGVKDVLLGRGIAWYALVTLGIVALFIGVAGGLIGRWTAEVVAPLNSDTVQLATDGSGDDNQPAGAVSRVADAVAKSVVSIDVRASSSGGSGSGFIIAKEGYVLTNNHVIAMAANDLANSRIEVIFFDRTRVPARIVGRDPRTDVAVLKFDNVNNPTVAQLGDSDDVRIGEQVIAFGSPLGLERTVTSGIVSALNRPLVVPPSEDDVASVISAIQTDASINPGNSGGPLVDDAGKVIGMNYLIASRSGGSVGLGFAIPINQAIATAQKLIRGDKIAHAQIGVNTRDVRNVKVLGAQVVNVVAGSPAAAAGLREGDVVTSFNGNIVQGADELSVKVFQAPIGKAVPFTYWRGGRVFNGTITPSSD